MRLRRVTGLCFMLPVAQEKAPACFFNISDEPNVTKSRLLFGLAVWFPQPDVREDVVERVAIEHGYDECHSFGEMDSTAARKFRS